MNFKTNKIHFTGLVLMVMVQIVFVTSMWAQNFTLDYSNVPLGVVLERISKQSDLKFAYTNEIKVNDIKVSIQCKNKSVKAVLDELFKETSIKYTISGKHVVLSLRGIPKEIQQGEKKITGCVSDEAGNQLPGVYVINSVTKANCATDLSGNYIISAREGEELVYTFIGMSEKRMTVGKSSVMNVTLQEDVILLDNVVVTGYQTISKERATGSFVKVGTEDFAVKPVRNISDALEGAVPGMSSNGNSRFVIRGVGTMQGQDDIDPLVVVDGFAVQGFSSGADPFEMLNPDEVESITVLKDAAATSIYGARAANGVIVVTTKKSKNFDKININFDARLTVMDRYDLDHFMNFADGHSQLEYVMQMQKYSTIYDIDPYANPTEPQTYLSEMNDLIYRFKTAGSISESEFDAQMQHLFAREGKWKDEYNRHFFRNALNRQYNLIVNGASKKHRYSFSSVFNKDTKSAIGDSEQRILLNISDTYKILDNLSFTFGGTVNIRKEVNNGMNIYDLRSFTTPFTTLFDENGDYAYVNATAGPGGNKSLALYEPIYERDYKGKVPVSWAYNPLKDLAEYDNRSTTRGARFQASLDYRPIESLNISLKGQYELFDTYEKNYATESAFEIRNFVNIYSNFDQSLGRYVSYFPAGGKISNDQTKYSSYNLRAQVDYNKTFKDKHSLTAMVIGELSEANTSKLPSYQAFGYNKHTNAVLSTPDFVTPVKNIFGVRDYMPFSGLGNYADYCDTFLSLGANVAYSYDNRYTVSASARSDASNYISDEIRKKFSPFWSVGFVWNAAREKFIADAGWIDDLRVRVSYGIAGVASGKKSISTLTTVKSILGSVPFTGGDSYSDISKHGNPTLTWEKSKTINAGVDFSFFKGKLYGSVEYYNRRSYDVIADATTPFISQSIKETRYNNAEIVNSGVELSVGSTIPISKRASWTGNLNFSYNKNLLTKYKVVPVSPGGDYVEGYPLSPVWANKLVGYTPEGLLKMEGKDGTVIEVKDMASAHIYETLEPGMKADEDNWKRFYGTYTAPYNMGFTNTFKFYGVTVSFLITGKFGHKLYYDNTVYPTIGDKGLRGFAGEVLKMDKAGYSADNPVFPMLNEANHDLFNAGNLYNYSIQTYCQSQWSIMSANHIRLNSVFVGYELPSHLFNKVLLKGTEFYFNATNLGTIWVANKYGTDPEAMRGTLKPLKNFVFGIKLNF